jgi:hypothetical protein
VRPTPFQHSRSQYCTITSKIFYIFLPSLDISFTLLFLLEFASHENTACSVAGSCGDFFLLPYHTVLSSLEFEYVSAPHCFFQAIIPYFCPQNANFGAHILAIVMYSLLVAHFIPGRFLALGLLPSSATLQLPTFLGDFSIHLDDPFCVLAS